MKKTLFLVMALFVLSLLGNGTQAYGMEMSAEQKELWSRTQTLWELIKKKDKEAIKAHLSKNFIYWLPDTMQSAGRISWAATLMLMSVDSYELKPYEVRITGNVGFVLYAVTYKDPSGAVFALRKASTYIKQDGEWLFLGGMASSCKNPPPCP